LRADLSRGEVPDTRELIRLLKPTTDISVAFDLPWPWGGEPFELRDVRSLNYIVGPLGSGKTRLAKRLAASLPDAAFVGLDWLANEAAAARASLDADLALKSRVDKSLAAIVDDGGATSVALLALLTTLESEAPPILVIDMLERGDTGGPDHPLAPSWTDCEPGPSLSMVSRVRSRRHVSSLA
jgi:hypothetical protein